MITLNVNGRAAVRLSARILKDLPQAAAVLFNCQGKKVWIPRSVHQVRQLGSVDVQEWWAKKNRI